MRRVRSECIVHLLPRRSARHYVLSSLPSTGSRLCPRLAVRRVGCPLDSFSSYFSQPSSSSILGKPALQTSRRTSQVTSFKTPGYYRLPVAKQIQIDPSIYEVQTMRGSGPGGQGTNSSSNKVELRVDMELLADGFEPDIIAALRRREMGKAVTADGTTLIVTSHAHRSALQNKEDCLQQIRELLHQASWVPPVDADPVQTPAALIARKKNDRRRKGDALRMKRAARQGMW